MKAPETGAQDRRKEMFHLCLSSKVRGCCFHQLFQVRGERDKECGKRKYGLVKRN